jgi:hypothetical protein
MNDDFEDFTPWQYTMEARVATLEVASDTHAAQIGNHEGLLTAMDKDVSDAQAAFRAQLAVLNSVRETQSEHITVLREHTTLLTEHSARLSGVEATLQKVHVGVDAILELLNSASGNDS